MLGVYLNLLKGYKLKTLWAQKKHNSKYLDNAPWFKSIIIELVEKMNPRWGPSLYFVSESELKLKVLRLRSFIILTPMPRLKGMWRHMILEIYQSFKSPKLYGLLFISSNSATLGNLMCQSQNKIDTNVLKGRFTDMKLFQNFCGFLILQFLPWYTKKMFLKKKTTKPPTKIFPEKNLLHCRWTLTLTACDFLKLIEINLLINSQHEKPLRPIANMLLSFINTIIIWDPIQMLNVFCNKTVCDK